MCPHTGTLNVYVKPTDGNRIQLFSSGIRQGHAWRHGQGNVNWNGDWQVSDLMPCLE